LIGFIVLALLSLDELPKADADGRIDPKKLAGIVVDDDQAETTGEWTKVSDDKPFVGSGYRVDPNQGKGRSKMKFTPDLPTAGKYRVKVIYPPGKNRPAQLQFVINGPQGITLVDFNQRDPKTPGRVQRLGVFRFAAGKRNWVEVNTRGADGTTAIDAIVFESVK